MIVVRLTTLALICGVVQSHRGLLTRSSCGNDFGTSTTALALPDPTISWAFKHYLDCTHRAIWSNFTAPYDGFKFYVGVGIPTKERFAGLRADAVIIGPGLPALTDEEQLALPAGVRDDAVWDRPGVGAVMHRSPADQSTCDHLGQVMLDSSSVKSQRCDFYEPYGSTNSWRVLDADENAIPTAGEAYHVAVWLQEHTSGKVGVALGTWKEDFWSPAHIATPTCTRDLSDFSEKASTQAEAFPVDQCDEGVVAAAPEDSVATAEGPVCEAGRVCEGGEAAGCEKYVAPSMGCGGEACATAAALWDAANAKMHEGMAIEFSGSVDLDFVRSMIPHHRGALDMCAVLVESLSCIPEYDDAGGLDGLVHFCNHVKVEQIREVGGMSSWLAAQGAEEEARCGTEAVAAEEEEHGDHGSHRALMAGNPNSNPNGDHGSHRVLMAGMAGGCGDLTSATSAQFVALNRAMHGSMGVEISCDHSVDFVRAMIPHHAGAVAMCDILRDAESADEYLAALCVNITRLQRAEVAWMSTWLDSRGHSTVAPCGTCADGSEPDAKSPPQLPCEDTLPTSSFCHLLGGDFFCTCEDLTDEYACGSTHDVEGFARLVVNAECARHCGLCPEKRPPLFHDPCPKQQSQHGAHDHGNASKAEAEGGCQSEGSFPYFCTQAGADAASPEGTSHQDSDAALQPWMPSGVASFHGDYDGEAPLCACHNESHHSQDEHAAGHGDAGHEHASVVNRGVGSLPATTALCFGVAAASALAYW